MYDETSALNSAKREGKEEGELKANRKIAKNLLSKGLELKEIAKILELDENLVEEIIKD